MKKITLLLCSLFLTTAMYAGDFGYCKNITSKNGDSLTVHISTIENTSHLIADVNLDHHRFGSFTNQYNLTSKQTTNGETVFYDGNNHFKLKITLGNSHEIQIGTAVYKPTATVLIQDDIFCEFY